MIGANFLTLAEQAVKENHSHIRYLEALLAMESEEHDRHAIQNRIRDAQLPRMKTLDEFDFGQASKIPAARVRERLRHRLAGTDIQQPDDESDCGKHLCATIDAHQCFPLSHLKDFAIERFRKFYPSDVVTKENIIDYIYALLHHPDYRERYAANLKLGLPRISFAPNFQTFARAGSELARLHVDYESLSPWPLESIENRDFLIPRGSQR